MGKNKLKKFETLHHLPNVYENFSFRDPQLIAAGGHPVDFKGQWSKRHFLNNQPLTLELACGRGEYTVAMAGLYPERNFIGIDIKGARIFQGATQALHEQKNNAAFVRMRIEKVHFYFQLQEVNDIWITFPDPFLRESNANRRLTSPDFLRRYQQIIHQEGRLHLKTDDDTLYQYSLEILRDYPDATILYHDDNIYSKPLPLRELAIKTYYERIHEAKGKSIKYIQFQLKPLNDKHFEFLPQETN
jgi:tRNA (guanine-N7-)-methyltransferase